MLKTLYFLALGIVLYAALITGSRGGLLGIGAIIFTFALSRLKKKTSLIIAITLMIFISFILLPEVFLERISKTTMISQLGEGERLSIWRVGLDIFKDSWFLGVGIDGFPTAYPLYAASFKGLAPHSNYVGVLVELGIIGIVLFVAVMYKHFALLKKRFIYHDHLSVMLLAVTVGLSIESGFLDTLWRKSFWLIWMLITMHNNLRKDEDSRLQGDRRWREGPASSIQGGGPGRMIDARSLGT